MKTTEQMRNSSILGTAWNTKPKQHYIIEVRIQTTRIPQITDTHTHPTIQNSNAEHNHKSNKHISNNQIRRAPAIGRPGTGRRVGSQVAVATRRHRQQEAEPLSQSAIISSGR